MPKPPVRVLLKLSGEALAGPAGFGIDPAVLERLCQDLAAAAGLGAQVALVCGGGNLLRGASLAEAGMNRVVADQMGMLATCMNGLAIGDALHRAGVPAKVFSAVAVGGFLPGYGAAAAGAALDRGEVAIIAGGTGNPFFTTDTAACLRGLELGVDAVLKATKVDGVYTADPVLDPTARRFETLSFDEALARNLRVMDLTAICLCRDHSLALVVFNLATPGALTRILKGEKVGTRILAAAAD